MMAAKLTVLVLCLLSGYSSSLAEEAFESAPWFCHGLDCPKYKVLNRTEKYEIREVQKGKWAATTVDSILYSVGVTTGFERLFKYIGGANEDKQKIAMTAPVLTKILPGEGPFCKSHFIVGFFVPFKWQDKPPVPSNPDVSIREPPSIRVAVTQFGGFLVDDYTLSSKAKALQDELEKDSIAYDSESYFTASYDPPYRLQHRHNEIWVPLAEQAQMVAASA